MLDRLPRRSESLSGSDPSSSVRASVTGFRSSPKRAGNARWNGLACSMSLDSDFDGTKSSYAHLSRLIEDTENNRS